MELMKMFKRRVSFLFILLLIGSILVGCSTTKSELVKEKGTGLTYSEYFKPFDGQDERENITYYKPFQIGDPDIILPENVQKMMKKFDTNQLSFTVDEEKAYVVTSKDQDGEVKYQVQSSYFSIDEYDQPEDFFIISVTEADKNPLESYDMHDKVDSVGNQLKKEQLTQLLLIYQQVLTTDSALAYKYYEESEKGITTVVTAANEFYAYYDGYIYHIGYAIDKEKNNEEMQEKMLQLVREYILAS